MFDAGSRSPLVCRVGLMADALALIHAAEQEVGSRDRRITVTVSAVEQPITKLEVDNRVQIALLMHDAASA